MMNPLSLAPRGLSSPRLGILLLVAGIMAIGCGKPEQAPTGTVPVIKVKPEQLSDPSQAANALFVEASLLFAQYNEAEGDLEKQYPLASKAMQNLEKIITTYTQTEMAVKLIQGQAIINGKAFSLLSEKSRFKKLELRFNASTVPSALLLFIAGKLEGKDKARALSSIASAMARAGDKAGAKVVFSNALAIAKKLEGEDKARALSWIAQAMAEAGDKAGAKVVFSNAASTAEKLEGEDKADALSSIASAMARAGDKAGALAIAEKLAAEERLSVLHNIAQSLCFTENKGTHGVGATPQKKLKPSFAPEDKPLVRKLLELLP